MDKTAEAYDIPRILGLFVIDELPRLINLYHLDPDSDCFILRDEKNNKFALLKTDHFDSKDSEREDIEAVGIEFVQWLHPKAPVDGSEVFTEYNGDYYALALVS